MEFGAFTVTNRDILKRLVGSYVENHHSGKGMINYELSPDKRVVKLIWPRREWNS